MLQNWLGVCFSTCIATVLHKTREKIVHFVCCVFCTWHEQTRKAETIQIRSMIIYSKVCLTQLKLLHYIVALTWSNISSFQCGFEFYRKLNGIGYMGGNIFQGKYHHCSFILNYVGVPCGKLHVFCSPPHIPKNSRISLFCKMGIRILFLALFFISNKVWLYFLAEQSVLQFLFLLV